VVSLSGIDVQFDENELQFVRGEAVIARFDMIKWLDSLPVESGQIQLDPPMITVFDQDDRKAALHIKRINRWIDEDSGEDVEGRMKLGGNVEFYLLTSGFKPKP
jgi:hypothetical protein